MHTYMHMLHMQMHMHMMHMQVTGVEAEDKKKLIKLCTKLGGTMAKKNADAASVTSNLPLPLTLTLTLTLALTLT